LRPVYWLLEAFIVADSGYEAMKPPDRASVRMLHYEVRLEWVCTGDQSNATFVPPRDLFAWPIACFQSFLHGRGLASFGDPQQPFTSMIAVPLLSNLIFPREHTGFGDFC
jgi:hypothetical protein